jgi:hypothetical protein
LEPFDQLIVSAASQAIVCRTMSTPSIPESHEQPAVKLAGIEGELELPRRQQHRRDDEPEYERHECHPAERMKSVSPNRSRAAERRA